jgi:Ca-activated chloride channel homolog
MPRRIYTLLTILLAAVAKATAAQADDDARQGSVNISVDVRLVVLPVSVTNQNGVVSGLSEINFEVYENGARQAIRLFRHEDTPVTVGLVVDHSGSMARKLPEVIVAARTFARSSNREDEMFVVNFNEHVTFGLTDATRFTNSADELETAIMRSPTTGLTALYDAAFAGLSALQQGKREKKVLIVISDGTDNASRHTLDQVLKLADQSGAVVYAIGTFDLEDPDRNPGVLRRLARTTGGEAFFPGESGDVAAICQRIAEDIRTQYTIGFVSNVAAKPGAYRSIRVAAKAPKSGKLTVRTRAGYFAGDKSETQGVK